LCPPHTPIVPAPEFAGKSGLQGKEGPYGDWLNQGDWVLSQVLQALERQKLADNTLILVSSDNGAAGRAYAPLRGAKTSIYEGGHREPFLARWPGKIKPASVCDDTICLNDLMATCAEIVGAKLPDNAGEDSVSILPDLLGTAKGPVREATIHQSFKGDLAIRQGPWKLIFLKGGKRELYNLQNDLSETKDVTEANSDVVKRLTALMNRYISEGRSTIGAPQKNDVEMSMDNTSSGGGKKKGKKGKKNSSEEVALAIDPNFD
jgi:arylsulfatase A-like enzyme